jgi:Domain of unknown function (DUF1911)/Domain of unknown function (DUF1910)
MIRDSLMSAQWYDEWIAHDLTRIEKVREIRKMPVANKAYEPQYVYEMSGRHLQLLLRRYCRGDPVAELQSHLPPLLDSWEEAERLGASVWSQEIQFSRHAWTVNLDFYIDCFWLTGLALALNISDDDWRRLVQLMGNEGQDALLDRVIASRQPGRKIGLALCHPQPYQRLLDAVQAPTEQRPVLLREFVTRWYRELDRPPKKGLSRMTTMYERPYWYEYDKSDGAYFGFWCVEAVAAVKAFAIDDGLCLGLPDYPGDLLRPDGPATHALGEPSMRAVDANATPAPTKPGLGSRVRRALFASR